VTEVLDDVSEQRRRADVARRSPRQSHRRVGHVAGGRTAGRRRERVGSRRPVEDDGAARRRVHAETGGTGPRETRLTGRPALVVGRVGPAQVCIRDISIHRATYVKVRSHRVRCVALRRLAKTTQHAARCRTATHRIRCERTLTRG